MLRILDLKSAETQVLVHLASRWASAIGVYNCELDKVEIYLTEVLPFGATAAVYGFGRMSVAIRWIGTALFGLVWTNFFNDIVQFDVQSGSK